MSEIEKLLRKIRKFRDDRDWMQFHNPKDMAIGLVLESNEVLEHFQWKTNDEQKEYVKKHRDEIGEEIADVAKYLLELADNLGIDLNKAIIKKIKKDEIKYPVSKSKGKHTKYTEL